MNKSLQNRAWACLPDDFRKEMSEAYIQGWRDREKIEKHKPSMCLRDRTKACDLCHECDIEHDQWYNGNL